jgi:hypothetical protein
VRPRWGSRRSVRATQRSRRRRRAERSRAPASDCALPTANPGDARSQGATSLRFRASANSTSTAATATQTNRLRWGCRWWCRCVSHRSSREMPVQVITRASAARPYLPPLSQPRSSSHPHLAPAGCWPANDTASIAARHSLRASGCQAGGAREPRLELLGFKDHWHLVVQLAHELIGIRDDHCARPDRLAGLSVSPFAP